MKSVRARQNAEQGNNPFRACSCRIDLDQYPTVPASDRISNGCGENLMMFKKFLHAGIGY
jgi:hypothetical protein